MADDAADMAAEVGGRVSDAASRAQQQVVDYFRNHNASDMLEDLNGYVKEHPTQALLAAAAIGFLTAALLLSGIVLLYGIVGLLLVWRTVAAKSGRSSASRASTPAWSPCSSVCNTSSARAITAGGRPASLPTWMP